jgi:hypothetical protein
MSRHSFDPVIAKQVGVNAAVIYQNILWWAEKNAANGKHGHDGLWWTYNSITAFEELFPYMTAKQIRTALTKLEDDGLVAVGCYNKSQYDRTKWYSPICPTGQMDLPIEANGFDQKGRPIPVINTDNKPVVNIEAFPDWLPMDAWQGWVDMRKQRKRPLTDRATSRAINKLDAIRAKGHDIAELLDRSTINGWLDIYEPKGTNNAGNSASIAEPTNPMVRAVIASQARRIVVERRPTDDWA